MRVEGTGRNQEQLCFGRLDGVQEFCYDLE
jgi:hypothetical protein